MSPERDSHEPEESRPKAPIETYGAAARGTPAGRRGSSSEPERSQFALILSELDERSKQSNQWLTGVSIVYVAVVAFLVAILYLRYSDVGKLVGQLEEHLDETDEAIAEQADLHRDQSKAITDRINLAGVDLDGLGKGIDSLEIVMETGMEKADELLEESDELQAKITEIDRLLAQISKRAEPFYVHYVIDPDKPLKYGQGKMRDVTFGEHLPDPMFPNSENVERNGKYLVPASGTYMVTGWFTAVDQEELPDQIPIVETEIRVDGHTYWSGLSHGTGIFTSGVPLRRGQILSIHATVRPSGDSELPSGSIDRGELRIARLYYSPD